MIIPNENLFPTHYNLDHPIYSKIPTFKYYDLPIMGVGPESKPFIRIDNYIDTSDFPNIYRELENNKDKLVPHTKGLVVNGVVPKEFNHGVKSIDSYLLNQSKYLNHHYGNDIKDLTTLSKIKSYFYNHFGIEEAWQGVCHLREFTNYANKNQPSKWLPLADDFPLLTKFVDSLPYKILGYAIFFVSKGNGKDNVSIHRDTYHRSHQKSNFINIVFDQKPRRFFIFDGISKEKVYLEPDCCMYMFNESDMHGVDVEHEPRYMLRVEGIFDDDFAQKLGLVNNGDYYEAFDWSYKKPQDFLKNNNLHIYQDTDI